MSAKKLTNRQKRQRTERNQRDERVKKLKKHQPLCVNRGFFRYASDKGWNDEMVDAAAWIMHRCFIRRRKSDDAGWIPLPYQIFKGMFGTKYKQIRNQLIESGFLERDEERGYKIGEHCTFYRLCSGLRDNHVSASYRLKSKGMQERYIENKEYWTRVSTAKRQERIAEIIEQAFSAEHTSSPSLLNRHDCSSYYHLVQEGNLTEEQFETIKRLATNAHQLQLKIDEDNITEIADRRFQKNAKNLKCDFEAYKQKIQDMAGRTCEPRISIKASGRFFSPYTDILRELWKYVRYKKKSLAGIDIKSSHVVCLLALIKDIDIHYFGTEGTHDDRLAQCQFGKQIGIVKGLVEHLRRSCLLFQGQQYFKFNPPKSYNITKNRELAFSLFRKFTKSYIKFIQHENICSAGIITNLPVNRCEFLKYLHKLSDIQLLSPSISNKSDFHHHSIDILLQSPTPHPIYAGDSVEFSLQPFFCHRVIEKIRACRFSLKTLSKFEESESSTSCVLTFRNLFFPSAEEIAEFEKLLDDDIYDRLMKAIGVSGTMSRDKFKTKFFHFLYRPAFCRFDRVCHSEYGMELFIEKSEETVRQAFEKLLPSITFFLDLCKCRPGTLNSKGNWYKQISRAMLSVESQIMLECCTNLWKKYPNMFLVTVHDCIKCLPKDVEKVQAELKRTWEKYHVSAKFEVKIHGNKCDQPQ